MASGICPVAIDTCRRDAASESRRRRHARTLSHVREEESRAAGLLRQLLGGEYTPRDTDGAQGMHDFDLQLDDGSIFAVEVTTDASRVDRAFWHQIDKKPLEVPGLTRVWYVYVATPGDGPDDQRASKKRSQALRDELPEILREFERAELTQWCEPRSQPRDDSSVDVRLTDLGVRRCSSSDPAGDQNLQVCFVDAFPNSTLGPSRIVDAVNECLSANKVDKLIKAKNAGADEAHLFVWLIPGQDHKRGRAESMFSLAPVGLDGLEEIDLPGIDAVWVAVEVDAPHGRPILRLDKHGWHYQQLRSSP